ncbi:globin-coupled sensor protein [Sporolactobacillus vineae]|uniref:globin-coupled sensor protein n=1 Tax=Sporolactobacillus vineae TaxID=444463 RepID=UPI0002897E0F|nr:globin-coupled sensor protein [Sporolactobacillus vineae]
MFLRTRKNTESSWLKQAENETVAIGVSDPKIKEKLDMLELTAHDLQLLKALRPFVAKEIDAIAEKFYASFYEIEPLRKIIDRYSTVEKLSKTLAGHIMNFFDGKIDDAFVESRAQVGRMHYKINLTPSYYMGTFQNIQYHLIHIVFREVGDHPAAEQAIHAINKMISLEQQIVLEVYDREYARNLEGEFEQGRQDLRSGMTQISGSLNEVTSRTRAAVKKLQDHFNLVQTTVHSSSEETEKAKNQASEGKVQLERLLDQVSMANRSITDMGTMVGRLKQASQEIGRVTDLVRDISEQTNILALNSAIEAARAGEYGKGFSVVSEEIRKLAEETNQATAQISSLIANSSRVTGNVVTSLADATEIIEKGMKESRDTGKKFEQIITAVDRSNKLSKKVDSNAETLAEITEQIGQGTNTLSDSVTRLMQKL